MRAAAQRRMFFSPAALSVYISTDAACGEGEIILRLHPFPTTKAFKAAGRREILTLPFHTVDVFGV
jgi:hypothetical protein